MNRLELIRPLPIHTISHTLHPRIEAERGELATIVDAIVSRVVVANSALELVNALPIAGVKGGDLRAVFKRVGQLALWKCITEAQAAGLNVTWAGFGAV